MARWWCAALILIAHIVWVGCRPKESAIQGESSPVGEPVPPRVPVKKPNQPPRIISITPSSGAGNNQVFEVIFTDEDGVDDIAFTQTLFHTSLAPPGGCNVHWERGGNSLYLLNDTSTDLIGPTNPGKTQRLENSQCVLDADSSSVTRRGRQITMRLALAFKPGFKGAQNIYLRTQDMSGTITGFEQKGVWTVP